MKDDNIEEFDESYLEETAEVSDRHKKRMNRIFREYAKSKWIPYPEVDNLFERFMSKCKSILSKKWDNTQTFV